GAWFAQLAGITLEPVPYRGGGPVINDLLAGHVKIASLGAAPIIPHYLAGSILVLAQATKERSPSFPNVPTFEEEGFDGLVLKHWYGLFVPATTPQPIVASLNAETNKALVDSAATRSIGQVRARAGRRQRRNISKARQRRLPEIRSPCERIEYSRPLSAN